MYYEELETNDSNSEDDWREEINLQHETGAVVETDNHKRSIIHIDIDCFYAQVEMINNPALRNKPLGIQQKNILVTCNYIARDQGLTKLMYLEDAKSKCKDLVIVNGENLDKYREMSEKIFGICSNVCPLVEKLGLDENFIDVTQLVEQTCWKSMSTQNSDGTHVFGDSQTATCPCLCQDRLTVATHIASELRRRLHEQLGITACAGIAHNKMLAKLAGSTHKPNQQTVVSPANRHQLMASLGSVRKVPGIGVATSKRLASLSVHSVCDLAECPVATLEPEFGAAMSQRLRQLVSGHDESPVVATGKPQSMSNEDSFRKCELVADVKSKMTQVTTTLLRRLLLDGRVPHTLRLTIRKSQLRRGSARESRQCSLPVHIFHRFSEDNLAEVCRHLVAQSMKLFSKMVDIGRPFCLTLVNVCLTKFSDTPEESRLMSFLKDRAAGNANTDKLDPISNVVQSDEYEEDMKSEYDDSIDEQEATKVNRLCKTDSFASKSTNSKCDSDENIFDDVIATHDEQRVNKSNRAETTSSSVQFHGQKRILEDCSDTDPNVVKKTKIPRGIISSLTQPQNRSTPKEVLFDSSQTIMDENRNSVDRKSHSIQNMTASDETATVSKQSDTPLRTSTNPLDSPIPASLPPDVDREVFLQLPVDVQRSIVQDYHAQSVSKEFTSMKVMKSPTGQRKQTVSAKSCITSFFKKK